MQESVDSRPLGFVRVSFGFLMVVYSANKCSDDFGNHAVDDTFYGFEERMPVAVQAMARAFPFYTDSHLYWHIHAPLMLLSAVGMALGRGFVSRFSCLAFAALKMVLTLLDQTVYNNHEYLYAVLALVLALLGGHDAVPVTVTPTRSAGLALCLSGTSYMLLNNVVYGIPGHIGMVGMLLLVWPGVVLLLGRSGADDRTDGDSDSAGAVAGDDNRSSKRKGESKEKDHKVHIQSSLVPFWHMLYLRLFLGLLYLFAGFAKTDYDWLSGQTITELFRLWTGPTANSFLRESIVNADMSTGTSSVGAGIPGRALVLFFTYGGLVLDLSAIFALNASYLPLRVVGALSVAMFHLMNHWTFVIETFPWVMVSCLAVHFDSEWIESCGQMMERVLELMRVRQVFHFLQSLLSLMVPIALVLIMAAHLLIPLPCALHTVGDDGSLAWGSSCAFFRWRMMTRSVRTLTTQLRFHDPASNRVDYVPMQSSSLYPDVAQVKECTKGTSLERYGFERDHALNTFLSESGAYEDRLSFVVQDALARIVPTDTEHVSDMPRVYADVWIEVNGPPFQRYVDSVVDLAQAIRAPPPPDAEVEVASALHSAFSSSIQLITKVLTRPEPLLPWVLPRLTEFRTNDWLQAFRRLQQSVLDSAAAIAPQRTPPNVVFIADHVDKGHLRLLFDEAESNKRVVPTEVMLLSGEALILNTGDEHNNEPMHIKAGTCIKARGMLVIRSVSSSNQPSLWMVVNEHREMGTGQGAGRFVGVGGGFVAGDSKPPAELYVVQSASAAIDDQKRKKFQYCFEVPQVGIGTSM